MISLPSLHLRFALVQSEPIVTPAEHGCVTSAQKSVALWRSCCCCCATYTVRETATTRISINTNPIVLEWLG